MQNTINIKFLTCKNKCKRLMNNFSFHTFEHHSFLLLNTYLISILQNYFQVNLSSEIKITLKIFLTMKFSINHNFPITHGKILKICGITHNIVRILKLNSRSDRDEFTLMKLIFKVVSTSILSSCNYEKIKEFLCSNQ